MAALPTGTVTLLFSDIEGSTKLLQRAGETYADLLRIHRQLLRAAFDRHGGVEVDAEGDAFFVAFATADDAVAAAAAAQASLAEHEWPSEAAIRVRMGLHTGTPRLVDGRYVGLDVHHAARVMAAGHGGQVLLSGETRRHLNGEPALVDLGEHRLKDLLQPDHLFQLVIDGLPQEFPALKTLSNRPTNLPVQPNALIGRENELRDVVTLLQSDLRLLTLTGVGGAGKTRLALQVGAELLDRFSSGVYFVSLAPVQDPALVVPTIAQTLALREVPGEEIAESLAAYLADKQMLLVVDNFEQIVDAAPRLAWILTVAERLKLLVTSRRRLGVAAERIFEVPPLGPLDGQELFVTRARAAKPDFALTAQSAAAVAEISTRLDGLPLALELAAARMTSLTPESLLRRLNERLKILTGGARDAEERQQTLRKTIEWSYDLLNEHEQELFARLSIFVDGCHFDAAEAVCQADIDRLQVLIEASLLRQRADAAGEARYWMLETIREYAGERLAADGEQAWIAERHADYYCRLAEVADALNEGPDAVVGLDSIAQDQENCRAALAWFQSHGDDSRLLRLAAALGNFWTMRGELREGRRWMRAALANASDDLRVQEQALRFAFWMAVLAGDSDDAELVAEQRAKIAEALGDWRRIAGAVLASAQVAQMRGDHGRARDLHEQAVKLSRDTGEEAFVASSLIWYGAAELRCGDYERARTALEEALAIGRRTGMPDENATALQRLAETALHQQRFNEADTLFLEMLPLARALGADDDVAFGLGGLAAVAVSRDDFQHAARLAGAEHAVRGRVEETRDEFRIDASERFYLDPLRRARTDPAVEAAWSEGAAMSLDEAIAYAQTAVVRR